MLHYIHIQGKEAPPFYFRDKTAQNFKSLIQSLSDGSSLVISSLYRTDVLYSSTNDLSGNILKLWSLQEDNFDPSRLTFVSGRDNALELFFTSLVSFSSASKWYEIYLEEFRHACSLDRNNPILKDLKLCEQYLQASHQTIPRPIAGNDTQDLLPRREVFDDLVKHINDFLN
ncbi:hypothetical protein [Ekhidna sp.]|uniref:hypothetical protein n=1 Tax=Ekhidna sp. TaxID=2608089 RepID=UPI0032EAC69C